MISSSRLPECRPPVLPSASRDDRPNGEAARRAAYGQHWEGMSPSARSGYDVKRMASFAVASLQRLKGIVFVKGIVGASVLHAQQAVAAPPMLVDNVAVVDVDRGKILSAQRIVIVGNRIQAMGSADAVKIPKGARVVDARGQYMIPGLWDIHTHSSTLTDILYPMFLANGITGIRDAGSTVPLDLLIKMRQEILARARVGPPRQILVGSAIDFLNDCSAWDGRTWETHLCISAATEGDARHVVDSLKLAGADMLKTYGMLKERYFLLAAEARRAGLPFGGHTANLPPPYPMVTAIEASDSGARILDHVNSAGGLDSLCVGAAATIERCRPVAERFLRNGTWWAPTLMVGWGGAATERIRERVKKQAEVYWADSIPNHSTLEGHTSSDSAATSTYLGIAQALGFPILAGTDVTETGLRETPPGFSLHAELEIYVAEGMSPLEALRTATLNPAKMLRATDSLGTVAPGMLADLVLLDANPLADITNTRKIRAVIADGRYFDRAELDQLLAGAHKQIRELP